MCKQHIALHCSSVLVHIWGLKMRVGHWHMHIPEVCSMEIDPGSPAMVTWLLSHSTS